MNILPRVVANSLQKSGVFANSLQKICREFAISYKELWGDLVTSADLYSSGFGVLVVSDIRLTYRGWAVIHITNFVRLISGYILVIELWLYIAIIEQLVLVYMR